MADDVFDCGQSLVEHRACLDRGEAEWLERLAEFDRLGSWELDGHFCCATWLMWRTGMGRSTALEKLRVAHELARRPIATGPPSPISRRWSASTSSTQTRNTRPQRTPPGPAT